MNEPSVIHNTFVIERSYPVAPDRVFAAFSDPAKKRRWFAESGGYDVDAFDMDFRPGGHQRVQSRFKPGSPFPGVALTNEGVYQDIVADRRIVIASTMSMDGRRFSSSLLT